jgi:hypothetical protein
MDEKMNRKGQGVTIWVIVGLIVVSGISLLFLFQKGLGLQFSGGDQSPEAFIELCTRNSVEEAVDIMLPHGGFIEPKNTVFWQGINVSYLCENNGYFSPCINQHPLFLSEMEKEIENYIGSEIEECYIELTDDLRKRNREVSLGAQQLEVNLGRDRINVDIKRRMSISRDGENLDFTGIEVEVISPAHNLGSIATEIASQEAKYCYFEYVGYMVLFPRYDIRVDTDGDSNRIYSIRDKNSDKTLNIAIRSCAIQVGI